MITTFRIAFRWFPSDKRESIIQNFKLVGLGFVAIIVTFAGAGAMAQAQQPTKMARIGYLSGNFPASESARTEAFRQGLRELGHVEGKKIVIEWRYGEGELDRVP